MDELLLLRVVVDELLFEAALLRAVRVVVELPLSVPSLRPPLFVPTEERVERFVLFVAALEELRPDVALPLTDVLRPVVEELRVDVALRPLTPDEEA